MNAISPLRNLHILHPLILPALFLFRGRINMNTTLWLALLKIPVALGRCTALKRTSHF